MKRFLMAAAIFASVFATNVAPSSAQYYPNNRIAVPYGYAQRDPLAGTTYMRVHNDSNYSIVSIRSSNMQFSTFRWGSPLSWAGGAIPPHSTVTVDFGDHTSACLFNVQMTTANGLTHVYGGINTCRSNDIVVPNMGW